MNALTFIQWTPTHHVINVTSATNYKQVNNINIHAKYNILYTMLFFLSIPYNRTDN